MKSKALTTFIMFNPGHLVKAPLTGSVAVLYFIVCIFIVAHLYDPITERLRNNALSSTAPIENEIAEEIVVKRGHPVKHDFRRLGNEITAGGRTGDWIRVAS